MSKIDRRPYVCQEMISYMYVGTRSSTTTRSRSSTAVQLYCTFGFNYHLQIGLSGRSFNSFLWNQLKKAAAWRHVERIKRTS